LSIIFAYFVFAPFGGKKPPSAKACTQMCAGREIYYDLF